MKMELGFEGGEKNSGSETLRRYLRGANQHARLPEGHKSVNKELIMDLRHLTAEELYEFQRRNPGWYEILIELEQETEEHSCNPE